MQRMEPGGTRISQLRRGVLEFCVLALLAETELYGFDLVRRLSDVEGLVTSAAPNLTGDSMFVIAGRLWTF